jgi:hypothetical protein
MDNYQFYLLDRKGAQQGRRELRRLRMMKRLSLKRVRRLTPRRLRFGKASPVWRPCCRSRGRLNLTLR